jgi:predicted nucleic acid-binding protein
MIICADTSFLISLYGADVNTSDAQQIVAEHKMAIYVHVVNTFEFENAVRLRCFQRKFSMIERDRIIDGFHNDVASGRVVVMKMHLDEVFEEAGMLSSLHTETLGNRAYDVLHVAAAKRLAATKFWSFDGRQRALAEAEGLIVGS